MKRASIMMSLVLTPLVAAVVSSAAAPTVVCGQEPVGETLTNDAVAQMLTAKVALTFIKTKIRTAANAFDVTPVGLANLYPAKVPLDMVRKMLSASADRDDGDAMTKGGVITMVVHKLPNHDG